MPRWPCRLSWRHDDKECQYSPLQQAKSVRPFDVVCYHSVMMTTSVSTIHYNMPSLCSPLTLYVTIASWWQRVSVQSNTTSQVCVPLWRCRLPWRHDDNICQYSRLQQAKSVCPFDVVDYHGVMMTTYVSIVHYNKPSLGAPLMLYVTMVSWWQRMSV